ncbi:mannose/fructose/sorbose PTS transporter subunit IIB [uncultured Clostridium sp.]|uniref:mannose/fructose/sorbose PTS transporter subunit IIB n=1 Tax=uncultured Clostridium sp. TaxID=59620 RepID=UPI002608B8F3|nr:mannose/fructose/sorbose PTS transporter subunit IIB [uncultured Clostridium sp.]
MEIKLVRIDNRLIHGQVATVWSRAVKCNRILVVSNEVAKDELRKLLLKEVTPIGIKSNVITVEKMIRIINDPRFDDFKVLLLFTNPMEVLEVVQGGVEINSINVGGMSFREGKTQITSAVSVNDEDIEAFKKLNDLGIELEIRKIVKDKREYIMDKIEKL